LGFCQSFNLNFGDPNLGGPESSYGAGAGQPGFWQNTNAGVLQPLFDINGNQTSALIIQSGMGVGHTEVPGATGNDSLLMRTYFSAGDSTDSVSLRSLMPGDYLLYVYGWSSHLDGSSGTSGVTDFEITVAGSGSGVYRLDYKAPTWPGMQVEGETYLEIPVSVHPSGNRRISISLMPSGEGISIIQGLQLVAVPAPSIPAAAMLATAWAFRRRR